MKLKQEQVQKEPLRILKDLTGREFGRLKVSNIDHQKNGYTYYKCRCSCGKTKVIRGTSLTSGVVGSCGCLRGERGRQRKIHGLCKHPLYGVWSAMKVRCNDINDINYGKRGICVADEWKNDFPKFYNWCLANGYKKGHSLDRINVDGNYTPDNCRFVTVEQQNQNKRNNRRYEFEGNYLPIKEISKNIGIPAQSLWYHLSRGRSVKDIMQNYSENIKINDVELYKEKRQQLLVVWNLNKELKLMSKQELVVKMLEKYPTMMVADITEKSQSTLYRDKKKFTKKDK